MVLGNGRKYYVHLLTHEELKQRGMRDKTARLVIQTYPVLVLSNEWLEELFCPQCGVSSWCHITKVDKNSHTVRFAPRELWQQVAHVDPVASNPSVSEFSRRQARRQQQRLSDGQRLLDPELLHKRSR